MPPVALITGASSGIGLALTHHLLSKSWCVLLCDLHPPTTPLPPTSNAHFQHTDVRDWDSQATAFAAAFALHNRLDFAALNAGIDDRDDIFAAAAKQQSLLLHSDDPAAAASAPPRKPRMDTFETNLLGVYFGLKLAAHYMLRNAPSPSATPGGRIVVTASDAGYVSLPAVPQYTASKHGVVGLVRAIAGSARKAGVAVNAIAPSLVPTGLAPEGLLEGMPRDRLTGMEVVMEGFEILGRFGEVGGGWGELEPFGKVLECRGMECVFREEEKVQGEGMPEEVSRAWERAYEVRNMGFALGGDKL